MSSAATEKTVEEVLYQEAQKGHDSYNYGRRWDNFFYNWGTGVAILLNTFAISVPDGSPQWLTVLAKAAACLATAWIAIERILQFGLRWRFSLAQQGTLRSLQVKLAGLGAFDSEPERQNDLLKVRNAIAEVFLKDANLPGISNALGDYGQSKCP